MVIKFGNAILSWESRVSFAPSRPSRTFPPYNGSLTIPELMHRNFPGLGGCVQTEFPPFSTKAIFCTGLLRFGKLSNYGKPRLSYLIPWRSRDEGLPRPSQRFLTI